MGTKIYIVTAINSEDDMMFQQAFPTLAEAKKEYIHQVQESVSNFKEFGTYEYIDGDEEADGDNDSCVVQASNCHTSIYLRSFEL